ncbi:DUF2867 domain-containing protein [Actinoplanes utahensis]|uniref:DUF2867 domain-containing protein n=1 Tax=Actinoplanes utahensis TaxID=1869 RepID=UPI0007C72072|nr:DUF2867 domain-containing protein [Actinoplanes utahensis]GIF30590.1 hypothetical protein Aut01nite_35760 [Actinoplanes utahensis]
MENVHERVLAAPAAEVGRLLDRLASADDPLWPSPTWAPVRFDRPLGVGADGGHDSIRYHVTAYRPGRLVECTFDPRIGLIGSHTFEVVDHGPGACLVRHRISARLHGAMRFLWPAIVRSCHDAVLEHLLDNAERAATGTVARPFRYPLRARLAVALSNGRVRSVPVPSRAALLHAALPHPDLADAFSVHVPPGTSTDPQEWADRVFRDPPAVVIALLRLRNALVAPFGIERGDHSAFDTIDRDGPELVLGTDAGHLDFRAGILVAPGPDGTTVTVSTHATARSRTGRAYLALVRLAHPTIVKAMLRRAARRATSPTTTATPARIPTLAAESPFSTTAPALTEPAASIAPGATP